MDAVRSFFHPFSSADFRWVFITRLLMTMAIFSVQEYVQYFVHDLVHKPYRFLGALDFGHSSSAATSFVIVMLLLGASLATVFAGRLSDRFGRKIMVYLSGCLQMVVIVVIVTLPNYTVLCFAGLVMGAGYGAFYAVDWALAADVLPSGEDHAKDMGLWSLATTIPQVVATPVAGLLLDRFERIGAEHGFPRLGFIAIFGLAFIYVALGTGLVRFIRSKPKGQLEAEVRERIHDSVDSADTLHASTRSGYGAIN